MFYLYNFFRRKVLCLLQFIASVFLFIPFKEKHYETFKEPSATETTHKRAYWRWSCICARSRYILPFTETGQFIKSFENRCLINKFYHLVSTDRAFSSSLLRAIIARNHLFFFKIFSHLVYFCPTFQICCPFFCLV